jgi:hypothetical protein
MSSSSAQGKSYLCHYYLVNSVKAEMRATSSKKLSQNSTRSWLTLPFTVHGIPNKFLTYYLMLTCWHDRKHILYILSYKSNYNTFPLQTQQWICVSQWEVQTPASCGFCLFDNAVIQPKLRSAELGAGLQQSTVMNLEGSNRDGDVTAVLSSNPPEWWKSPQ